jgi:hypothetical protein
MEKSLHWFCFAVCVLITGLGLRAEPDAAPQNRAWVIHTYGEPTGTVKAGEREILTYPQGRVVLKNGLLFSSTMDGSSPDASAAPAPATESPKPAAVAGWLGSMEIAKARARAEQKRVLLLYWGGDSSCPWAPVFNRTIVGNRELLARLEADYVLVKIMYPPKISAKPSEAEFSALEKAEKFRLAVVETQALPAMAIVSADGLSATKVEIENAMSAKNYMERFVLKALAYANKQKPKKIKL